MLELWSYRIQDCIFTILSVGTRPCCDHPIKWSNSRSGQTKENTFSHGTNLWYLLPQNAMMAINVCGFKRAGFLIQCNTRSNSSHIQFASPLKQIGKSSRTVSSSFIMDPLFDRDVWKCFLNSSFSSYAHLGRLLLPLLFSVADFPVSFVYFVCNIVLFIV